LLDETGGGLVPAEIAMLLVVEGAEPGKRIFLDKAVLLIGRDEQECDLVVAERQVSRHHALISVGDDGYTLKDLGSKNGTFLNGKELEGPRALQDGDEIQIAY
jgi:pSer/pThr/pTyr-binding forkhead associated (FHA) protein